jgi:hypothetical protein
MDFVLCSVMFVATDREAPTQAQNDRTAKPTTYYHVNSHGRQVVNLHDTKRCDLSTLNQCARNNYDACVSTQNSQTCPQTASFGGTEVSEECGCGFLYDFELSVNILPIDLMTGENNNPTDPTVIESICYTQDLDAILVNIRCCEQRSKECCLSIGYI